MQLNNGTTLTLVGAIDNSDAINLNGDNYNTDLIIGTGGATLTGGGQVNLDDSPNNRIYGAAAADVRDLVLLRHDRLRLDEVGGIAAEHRIDIVLHGEPLVEVARRRGVGLVVVDDQLDRNPSVIGTKLQTAGVVDFLCGQLVGQLEVASDAALLAGERQHRTDDHLGRAVVGPRGRRHRRADQTARDRRADERDERALHPWPSGTKTDSGAGTRQCWPSPGQAVRGGRNLLRDVGLEGSDGSEDGVHIGEQRRVDIEIGSRDVLIDLLRPRRPHDHRCDHVVAQAPGQR